MAEEHGAATGQHAVIGVAGDQHSAEHTNHPQAQWFATAGMGMFIHYGLPCVQGNADLSWGMVRNTIWDWQKMNRNKMVPVEYYKQAESFNPENYDPERWIAAAAKAGMRYAVLTTRHHDGYALWPSKYGELSTRTHMGGRDLVKPYIDACRKYGLKVGLYYSPPDWYFNREYTSFGFTLKLPVNPVRAWMKEQFGKDIDPEIFDESQPALDMNWQPTVIPQMPQEHKVRYAAYVRGQVMELLQSYGTIDLLWFDGTMGHDMEPAISLEEIRAIQPGIVVNPRLHGTADYDTPECEMPPARPKGWWEGCFIWNEGGWGYTRNATYKSLAWYLDLLAKHRSWEGNLLINCAPGPDGDMPPAYYERMGELTRWMQGNAQSVVDVQAGPGPDRSNVPVTVKGDMWYLHMKPGLLQAVLLEDRTPKSAVILDTGEAVPFHKGSQGTVYLALEQYQMRDQTQVIALQW